MAKGTTRIPLDMGEKFRELLETQAEAADATKVEFIRRAVATYAYLRGLADKDRVVTIRAQDGREKDLIIP